MTELPGGTMPPTEEDLRDRLAAMYEEYFARIARYAYIHIGNRHEAEDLAEDTFLRALESLKTYRERGVPVQAWLFKIAHNLVVDHLRKKTRRQTLPVDDCLTAGGEDAEVVAETKIEVERVKKAMKELTPEQQEVISLRFFGGFTSKETAAIMDKNDGAVREMQRNALIRLRRLLAAGL
jgi:RNA polymerase sigma-70 factor (ECF subfamily)